MEFLQLKQFKGTTRSGVSGVTVPQPAGTERSTELETVPILLPHLEEWTVHLSGWTETYRLARNERVLVGVMDARCNTCLGKSNFSSYT